MRSLEVGSVYWPGLRDGDWYSLTSKTGSGSDISLSLVNRSGLDRLHYAWRQGNSGGTYVKIRNAATGLHIDGSGSSSNGSNADQWSDSASTNQQWRIVAAG